MNKTVLLGRLTREPEVKVTEKSTICRFTLAVNRTFKKEGQPDADFINIVAFGKTAEFCSKYFTKGQQVCVCGRLQTGSYDDKEGKKIYTTDVIAEEVDFAGSKQDKQENKEEYSQDGFMSVLDIDETQLPF